MHDGQHLHELAMQSLPDILNRIRGEELKLSGLADLGLLAGYFDANEVSGLCYDLVTISGDLNQIPGIRGLAVINLEKHFLGNAEAKTAILARLDDPAYDVRRQALQSLGNWPHLTDDDLQKIRVRQSDKDVAVRHWSAIVLRNIQDRKTDPTAATKAVNPSGGSDGF